MDGSCVPVGNITGAVRVRSEDIKDEQAHRCIRRSMHRREWAPWENVIERETNR